VAVCRELTKVNEELVRGPIIEVVRSLTAGRGGSQVCLNIGLTTDVIAAELPTAKAIADEFGIMTKNSPMTRRKAINALARKHGLAPNLVYEMLEATKKSG